MNYKNNGPFSKSTTCLIGPFLCKLLDHVIWIVSTSQTRNWELTITNISLHQTYSSFLFLHCNSIFDFVAGIIDSMTQKFVKEKKISDFSLQYHQQQ